MGKVMRFAFQNELAYSCLKILKKVFLLQPLKCNRWILNLIGSFMA